MAVMTSIPKTLEQTSDDLQAARGAAADWLTVNQEWLRTVVEEHKTYLQESRVEEYQAAYDGHLDTIEDRDKDRGDDVNHKLQATLAGVVIDFVVDYMLGKAIVWSFEDKADNGKPAADKKELLDAYRGELLELLESEEGQRVLREVLTQGSVSGYWAALGWVDEDGNIDFEDFPVQEMIPVYDTRGRLRLVIRAYEHEERDIGQKSGTQVTKIEVYDERFVLFAANQGGGTDFALDLEAADSGDGTAVYEHGAARIPVSVFINGSPASYKDRRKKVGVSDLAGGVLDLVDAYAQGISDKANWTDRLQDSYLVFTGVKVGATKKEAEAEVMAMRKSRAISLSKADSKAAFIAPVQDDEGVENYLDRVRDTLHEKAFIPKLSDLSGATATEIKVKYAGVDIKAGKKEVYFTGAVKRLVAILTDFINAKRLVEEGRVDRESVYAILTGEQAPPGSVALYDPKWAGFTLNRNMPQNYLEIAQVVAALSGIVPDSYLYELLWFVPDPKAALDEMKQQKADAAKAAAASLFPTDFNSTGADPSGGAATG